MARWCHRCGRPKEEHTQVGEPRSPRECVLKQVKAQKDDPYPIFRAMVPGRKRKKRPPKVAVEAC